MPDLCGKWMPRAKATCAKPVEHAGHCNVTGHEGHYARYRDAQREVSKRYKKTHRAQVNERVAIYRESIRQQVFDHYGWECSCCGSEDDLTLDHVNGDGAKHRLELYGCNTGAGGVDFYRYLVTHDFPTDYELQTLCGPCNWSKHKGTRCNINHSIKESVTCQ